KLRCDHNAIEKTGFGDIGNAPVDDYAGVENFVALLELFLSAKNAAQGGKIQQVAFIGPDDQPHIGHQQHDHELEEISRRTILKTVLDDQGKQVGPENSENAANGRADQALEAHAVRAAPKANNGRAKCA